MSFRSKDVIHSAYFPPKDSNERNSEIPTRFKFTPSLTTEEMRKRRLIQNSILF